MSPAPNKVVVVGSINVDQVITVARHPLPGETLIGTSIALLPGGKGANQALAAARLGASVTLIAALGSDPQAALATSLLIRAGVDLSGLRTLAGPTGLALITVADDGENTIVVIPGANASMDAAAVAAHQPAIAGAAVVVLQGEIPASGIEAASRLARGRMLLNLAPVIALAPALIRRADPLVVNQHEAALVLAQLDPAGPVAGDEAELVARLLACGLKSVVLTRGAQGALCADAQGSHALAAPVVVAVDTSGAGDAFVGALSAQLAAGASLLDAVRLAVRVGAFAVQRRGTQAACPTLADVLPELPPAVAPGLRA
jgi:ribokinase